MDETTNPMPKQNPTEGGEQTPTEGTPSTGGYGETPAAAAPAEGTPAPAGDAESSTEEDHEHPAV